MHSNDDLFGLVLAGGKSSRMGRDKSTLSYHSQIQQRRVAHQLLMMFCKAAYISCRAEQEHITQDDLPYIPDKNQYGGPMNGILSAHHLHPEAAWLVIAVDLPHVKASTIETLVGARNPEKMATAYATHSTGLPEPLAAIWEPQGLISAEEHLQHRKGNCPRKLLLKSDIQLVYPDDDLELFNANYPEDYYKAKNYFIP